jgi:hypothetical protein
METSLDLKMIGMYSINKVAPDKVNCLNCNNADWGDVLIEGVCGRCLIQAWQAEQARQAIKDSLIYIPDLICVEHYDVGGGCSCGYHNQPTDLKGGDSIEEV